MASQNSKRMNGFIVIHRIQEDEWSNFGLGINHYYAVEGKHFGDDDYV